MARYSIGFGLGLLFSVMALWGVALADESLDEPVLGHITYTLPDHTVYRLAAQEGALPENISAALDGLSPRQPDRWLNISPDGQWLLLSTERFDPDCQGWACLALVGADLTTGESIKSQGSVVRAKGFSAVASGGDMIIYSNNEGPHDLDLFAIRRADGVWSAPALLTGGSPYAYHELPAVSADGTKVVFIANQEAYSMENSVICEVGTDGQGFRVVLTPADSPAGFPDTGNLVYPDYDPEGGIVFEANWDGERIWRLPVGAAAPVAVPAAFSNDNSPCVLPDGRIVSLWLNREGGQGYHEIKVMAADGSEYYMALTGIDMADIGMGCGN